MAIVYWLMRAILWAALLACWGGSMFANYNQALIFGANRPEWMIAVIVVVLGLDLIKVAAPLAMRSCWIKRSYIPLMVGLPIWGVVLGTSIYCATTFYGARFVDQAAGRARSSFQSSSIQREIVQKQQMIEGYEALKLKTPVKQWEPIDTPLNVAKAELVQLRERLATEPVTGEDGDAKEHAKTLATLLVWAVELVGAFGLVFFAPMLGVDLEAKVAAAMGVPPPGGPPRGGKKPAAPENTGDLPQSAPPKGRRWFGPKLATINGQAVSDDPKGTWKERAEVLLAELAKHGYVQDVPMAIAFEVWDRLALERGWERNPRHDKIGSGLGSIGVVKRCRRAKGQRALWLYVLPSRENVTKTPDERAG